MSSGRVGQPLQRGDDHCVNIDQCCDPTLHTFTHSPISFHLHRALEGLMECWQWVGGQRPEEAEPGTSWQPPASNAAKRPRYSLSGKTETERVNVCVCVWGVGGWVVLGMVVVVWGWGKGSHEVCLYTLIIYMQKDYSCSHNFPYFNLFWS